MAIHRIFIIMSVCVLLNFTISSALPKPVTRPGGVRNMSVDDPNVKRLAEATLRKLRRQHQGDRALMLIDIEMATYQVVAGAKYHLHLKVGESHCAKNKYSRMCRLDEERPLLACGSEIWEKAWINFMQINVHCKNYDGKKNPNISPELGSLAVNQFTCSPRHPCLGEHVRQSVPVVINIDDNRYSEVEITFEFQFSLRVAEVRCQSLRGKTDIQVKPVELVADDPK